LKERFNKVHDFLGDIAKSEKLTEKQKHVYGEIVNYVKMLNEEKTRMDLN